MGEMKLYGNLDYTIIASNILIGEEHMTHIIIVVLGVVLAPVHCKNNGFLLTVACCTVELAFNIINKAAATSNCMVVFTVVIN